MFLKEKSFVRLLWFIPLLRLSCWFRSPVLSHSGSSARSCKYYFLYLSVASAIPGSLRTRQWIAQPLAGISGLPCQLHLLFRHCGLCQLLLSTQLCGRRFHVHTSCLWKGSSPFLIIFYSIKSLLYLHLNPAYSLSNIFWYQSEFWQQFSG